jgi:hypothetical protein
MSVLFNRTVRHSSDLERILKLPRRSQSAVEFGETIAEEMTELLKTPQGTQKLRAVQAAALHDIGTLGGLFGPIPVGFGKTLISLLAPYVLDAQRPLLVLPAALIKKTKIEQAKYAEHWRVPSNLQIISYEMLGRVQAATFLEEMNPDLVIFDEVHRAKNKRAAVTRRLIRYMRSRPNTMVVALSGTVMRKSLLDFGHILRWCLKKNAPIPETDVELEEWAQALDEKLEDYERADLGALKVFSGGLDDLDAVRRGFKERLISTPGVVAVTGGEDDLVTCSLRISALKYNVAPVTEQHIENLRNDMLSPDGWQYTQAVDVWRVSKELALGFHYVRVEKSKYYEWLKTQKQSRNGSTIKSTTENIRPRSALSNELGVRPTRAATESQFASTSKKIEIVTLKRLAEIDSAQSTASARPTINSCSSTNGGRALSVESQKQSGYTSTTTTRLGLFEAFSADPAIEASDYSRTMESGYREQFPTFVTQNRPPREWLNARSQWASFVRETLSKSRTLDSELQVAQACQAGRLDPTLLNNWLAIKDSFHAETVAYWHDDSALRVCVEWMREPGIVWVEHQFFGHCLAALSGKKYYGAKGLTDRGEFIDDASPKHAVILSIDANKEGRNLQHKWSRNLVTAPPEGADVWQQMLGRTHRPGQIADEVEVDVLLGCKEHANAWRRALSAAEAIRDTTGADSKLLLADVDWPSEDEIAGYAGARWR